MAVTLKTPRMAAYDPKPIRLMAMHQKTEIHTARIGVPVIGRILVQRFGNGKRRSREKAKTVRARDCIAVKVTNLRMMKAQRVKTMPPALPRTL